MPRTERQLWNSLRQKLPKKTHCQRIENRAGEGMPDVYLCMDGVPVWAELKITKNDRFTISKSYIDDGYVFTVSGIFLVRREEVAEY